MINKSTGRIPRRAVVAGALALPIAMSASLPARAEGKTIRVSDLGFDPEDSTRFLTQAIESDADTVIIDQVGEPWITGPLRILRDNLTVIIEDGVLIKGKAAAFPDRRDGIWLLQDCRNVRLIGYGARCEMTKTEYPGEWRAIVRLRNVQDVAVEGMVLAGAPGDGFIVASSTDVIMRNVVCDDNLRNGLSVISVRGMLVEGCAFTNTSGTAPESGVDVEPDTADQPVLDLVFRDCLFASNADSGFQVNLMRYTPESVAPSILLERCRVGPHRDMVVHLQGGKGGASGGWITMRDSLVDADGSEGTANVYAIRGYDALRTTFERTTFSSRGNPDRTNPLIKIWSGLITVQPTYGGSRFPDCIVLADQAGPWLAGVEGPGDPVFSNVSGTFTGSAVNPAYETAGVTQDFDVTFTPTTGEAKLIVQPLGAVRRGGRSGFVVHRVGGRLSEPIAVRYTLSGTARNRIDYDGLSGVAVFATGQRTTVVPIVVRSAARTAPGRQVEFTIEPAPNYQATVVRAAIKIIS